MQHSLRSLRLARQFLSCLGVLLLTFAISCSRPQPHEPPVCLRVHLDMPDRFGVRVQSSFRSIPDRFWCKGVSTRDGKFKPLREGVEFTVPSGKRQFLVPLKWPRKSSCRYVFHDATVFLVDADDPETIRDVVAIYPRTSGLSGWVELPDTVVELCGDCNSLYRRPHIASICCLQRSQEWEGAEISYYLPETDSDTISMVLRVSLLSSIADPKENKRAENLRKPEGDERSLPEVHEHGEQISCRELEPEETVDLR